MVAKYNEAKAREVLETVLLADGQYEKNLNPEYNQDDFLDELIISEIPGSRIQGDVAIIGEWAFELDRSVPKIGRGLGKADKLVFPTLNVTAELASDKKNATINITAKEEKNGINKIEIWLLGEKIEEYTYDNIKTEITVDPPYIATQNGKYIVKAYGDLMASKTVEVTGIVASVTFEPNGNEEWNKSHSTVVTIEETADKVVKAQYVWTNSVNTPDDNQFPDTQTFNSEDTITGGNDNMTGTYYLWTMLETKSGNKAKRRSEGFNFDNEGPTITSFTAEKYSETGITLSATAQDTKSGIVKFEFYIDGVLQEKYTKEQAATTESVTETSNIIGLSTGEHTCMVRVYDAEDNSSTSSKSGTTKLYTWERWSLIKTYAYVETKVDTTVSELGNFGWGNWGIANNSDMSFNCSTGCWSLRMTYRNTRFCACDFNSPKNFIGKIWAEDYSYSAPGTSCYIFGRKQVITNTSAKPIKVWRDVYQGVYSMVSAKKGTTQYPNVTSNDSSAYPKNTYDNSYWYDYKGAY